jgi:lipopolysaccharide export LptBFGC system permease protein LptF
MTAASSPPFRLFTTLDAMLMRETATKAVACLALFTLLWLAPETLFRLTHALLDGRIALNQFGELLLFSLPSILEQSIPLGALFAGIFTFRRLSLDSELVSLWNAGIPLSRLMVPVLAVGFLLTASHALLQEVVTPLIGPRYETLKAHAGLSTTRPTSFATVLESPEGRWERFFLVDNILPADDHKPLQRVFVLDYAPTGMLSTIRKADTGQWDASRGAFQLNNSNTFFLNEQGLYVGSQAFAADWVALPQRAYTLLTESLENPKQMAWERLSRYIDLLKANKQPDDARFFEARLAQKVWIPLAATVFLGLGCLLGMEPTRSSRAYALVFGALLVFVYSVVTPACIHLAQLGLIAAWLAAGLPLAITVVVGLLFIRLRRRLERG